MKSIFINSHLTTSRLLSKKYMTLKLLFLKRIYDNNLYYNQILLIQFSFVFLRLHWFSLYKFTLNVNTLEQSSRYRVAMHSAIVAVKVTLNVPNVIPLDTHTESKKYGIAIHPLAYVNAIKGLKPLPVPFHVNSNYHSNRFFQRNEKIMKFLPMLFCIGHESVSQWSQCLSQIM
ncbi:hypothetical protein T05_3176 [Trichinella murrelli]|uniref:Uncharacterized protein n=1 Tax=Trichinella murrelli TaxID=144512 RepID=A0A0V0U5Z6_9BILA|nr:hypothetical protein T05_3176 [Trichinella murrelli]